VIAALRAARHHREGSGEMSGQDIALFVVLIGACAVLFAAIYAFIYGLIARFGMNARLNALRSYWASVVGLVLGFSFLAAVNMQAFYSGAAGRWGYAAAGFGGLALIMAVSNMLIVRTKEGGRINFIQGFMLQLVPNILLIAYTIATRPPY
jgi:hypothetical protein